MEQEEYTREEIDWSYVEFVDNQDVLDLIERVKIRIIYFIDIQSLYITFSLLFFYLQKPGGIIALLDEAW